MVQEMKINPENYFVTNTQNNVWEVKNKEGNVLGEIIKVYNATSYNYRWQGKGNWPWGWDKDDCPQFTKDIRLNTMHTILEYFLPGFLPGFRVADGSTGGPGCGVFRWPLRWLDQPTGWSVHARDWLGFGCGADCGAADP